MPFSEIKVQEQSYFYFNTKYLVKSQVNTNLRFFKEQDGKNVKIYSFTMQCHCQKIFLGWVGFQKSYVIFRVGHGKCLRMLTRWVGGEKKGQKHAYVIFEWSQR